MFKYFFILIIMCTSTLHAETPYDRLKMREKKDYDFVLNTCHGSIDSMATLLESTKSDTTGYFTDIFPDTSQMPSQDNLFSRKGLGKETYRLLNSSGYFLALKTCFPNNENARNRYTINLLLLDAYGKVVTISIVTVSGAAIYKTLAFLGRKLAIAPTVFIFKKLNASPKFVSQIPTYMGKAGAYSLNGLMVISFANYLWELKNEREVMGKPLFGDPNDLNRQALKRNLELYYRTLELRNNAKTSVDQAAMENLLKEQQEMVLFYIDNLLEQENVSRAEKQHLVKLREEIKKA